MRSRIAHAFRSLTALRLPIRVRWTLLVALLITSSIGTLTYFALGQVQRAWYHDKELQAHLLVDRLGDELKLPMLSGNHAEVQLLLEGFHDKVPDIATIYLHQAKGKDETIGDASQAAALASATIKQDLTTRLPLPGLCFGRAIHYSGAVLGSIRIQFSDQSWQHLAEQLAKRMLRSALGVLFLTLVLVYWLAGRMSKPMELLAQGSKLVAGGDFSIRLPPHGNNEIGDAMREFNHMVGELEHKAQLRDQFGRYLNPALVSSVFDQHSNGPESQRMEVSVLFADMVSFTPFSQQADTADVIAILNRYFELFNYIINHFGGHVDKFIGDAVMAIFNHPKRDDAHLQHAAMAALAMGECCRRLHTKRPGDGKEVAFRFGINRGEVIVGNIGASNRQEFAVIGDAVNVAARMESLSSANKVVAPSASFAQLTGHNFTLHDIGIREVKGISEPMHCVEVSAENPELQQLIEQAVEQALINTFGQDYEDGITP
ncbi:MAG: adenylate/guanylate cyclase domain-containing protein [Mariprofundales bacterium]|nr:adenylate/guanylate cyclase domain-containing protein [Mariprofundales bacterium]